MNSLKKLILIFSIAGIFQVRAEIVETNMWACCSPYGLCDLRLFQYKSVCQQVCGGVNQCKAKAANIVRDPTSGLPVAHISSNTSAYVTGVTSEGSSMAITGGESGQLNTAPRKLEITVNAPIAEQSRR